MASYSTSDFKKGIKVQIDGDPYLMIECNFVKPGKGNALYKCRMRNLVKNTVLDRTYKGGDSLEAADVEEIDAQFLYRQADQFVFMDNANYEQYELTSAAGGRRGQVRQRGHGLLDDTLQQQPDLGGGAQPRDPQDRILRTGHARQHGHQPDQAGQTGNRGRNHLPGVRRTSAT